MNLQQPTSLPPPASLELPGWGLFWAELVPAGQGEAGLAALRTSVTAAVRERLRLETLSEQPQVVALRRLFRRAGCDPTRYRSGSEALLRRLLKGEEMPAVSPLVDLGNCLAAGLVANVCVLDAAKVVPPFLFRAGRPGEGMLSLRGPFDCAGKPLLLDAEGPADVPITGADRVRVDEATRRAWVIVYLPEGTVTAAQAEAELRRLLEAAPVAALVAAGETPALAR